MLLYMYSKIKRHTWANIHIQCHHATKQVAQKWVTWVKVERPNLHILDHVSNAVIIIVLCKIKHYHPFLHHAGGQVPAPSNQHDKIKTGKHTLLSTNALHTTEQMCRWKFLQAVLICRQQGCRHYKQTLQHCLNSEGSISRPQQQWHDMPDNNQNHCILYQHWHKNIQT